MAAGIILLIAVISMSAISGITSQKLRFSNGLVYNNTCGFHPQTMWSTEGSITLTPGDLIAFESKVVINVNKEVCSVDLSECPPKTLPPSMQSCYCMSKTNDEYQVHVGAVSPPAHSGMTLQAVVPGRGPLKDIFGAVDLGVVSHRDDTPPLEATFTIGEEPPRSLSDVQTISICPNERFELEICVNNKDSKAELKISTDSRVNAAVGSCIFISHQFGLVESKAMIFSYKEPKCTYQKRILFKDDFHSCSKQTTAVTELDGVCPATPRLLVTHSSGPTLVLDTVSFNASWIVIQRRTSGSVDFNRPWSDYEEGFGDKSTSFWIGLKEMHNICNSDKKCELLVNIKFTGNPKDVASLPDGCYYAKYSQFWLGGPSTKYRVTVSGFSGTAGDSFTGNGVKHRTANGQPFTTKDQDNDNNNMNCAILNTGGGWFNSCFRANLNGEWGASGGWDGLIWDSLTGKEKAGSTVFSEMKVRHLLM